MAIYHPSLVNVDLAETKRYAGLARCQDFAESLLKQACNDAQILAVPKGSWHIYDYCADTGVIMTAQPLELTGKSIKNHLRKCQQVAVMAVTIGSDIEAAINQYFNAANYTAGLLLDAAATTAVETIADQLNALIAAQGMQRGFTTVSRFSPGYGDWDISVQAKIAALAGASAIGITVSETSMLIPRKSITAIIGLSPRQAGDQLSPSRHTGCTACTQTNCPVRRI